MSLYLNDPDPSRIWTPTPENRLDFCAVRSTAHLNRWLFLAKHDWAKLPGGEIACQRCGRLQQQVETEGEAREQRRNLSEL